MAARKSKTSSEAGVGSLTVAGEEVTLLNDNLYSKVRSTLGYSGWFEEAVKDADFGKLACRTNCKRFIIKEVSKSDNKTLVNNSFLQAYVERVCTKQSLLVHVLAHFIRRNGSVLIVINNLMPTDADIKWDALYDLKGTADDKTIMIDGERVPEYHKRCWHVRLMVCEATCDATVPAERRQYREGKHSAYEVPFHVSQTQRKGLLASMTDDLNFLKDTCKTGLMDYSLLVGIRRLSLEEAQAKVRAPEPAKGDSFVEPILTEYGGEVWVYYVGIIDFLQMWTGGKKVAHVIKECFAPHPISTVAPNAYAKQFLDFFAKKFLSDGNDVELVNPVSSAAAQPDAGAAPEAGAAEAEAAAANGNGAKHGGASAGEGAAAAGEDEEEEEDDFRPLPTLAAKAPPPGLAGEVSVYFDAKTDIGSDSETDDI